MKKAILPFLILGTVRTKGKMNRAPSFSLPNSTQRFFECSLRFVHRVECLKFPCHLQMLLSPVFYKWRNRGIERGHTFPTVGNDIELKRQAELEPHSQINHCTKWFLSLAFFFLLDKVLVWKRSLS